MSGNGKFVIYTVQGEVVGLVEHESGERAVSKAEDVVGVDTLLWNSWENATPAERRRAESLPEMT